MQTASNARCSGPASHSLHRILEGVSVTDINVGFPADLTTVQPDLVVDSL